MNFHCPKNSWASVYRSQIVSFWKEFVTRTNFFYAEKIDGQWKFINRNHNRASVYRSQIVSFKKEFVIRTDFFYAEKINGQWKFINRALPCLFGDFIENRSVIYIIVNSLRGFRRNPQKSKVNRSVSRSALLFLTWYRFCLELNIRNLSLEKIGQAFIDRK